MYVEHLHVIIWILQRMSCHLADLGFKQISIEPVVAPPTEEYALQEEDIPQLLAEYDKLAAEYAQTS